MTEPRTRSLTCCTCGEPAGTFQQWWNRDTGYGLCARCRDWLTTGRGERNMPPEEMRENYGEAGVHYPARDP